MAVTPDVHIWLWPWFNGLCSLLCVMYVYFHVFFNWINSSQLVYGEGERERTWAVSLWPQNGYTSVWLSREIDLDTLKMNHEWWSPDSKGRSWNIKSKMWVPIGLLNNLFITLLFNKTNFFYTLSSTSSCCTGLSQGSNWREANLFWTMKIWSLRWHHNGDCELTVIFLNASLHSLYKMLLRDNDSPVLFRYR